MRAQVHCAGVPWCGWVSRASPPLTLPGPLVASRSRGACARRVCVAARVLAGLRRERTDMKMSITTEVPVVGTYKLAAPRIVFYIFLWPAFVTRLLTPRSRKSGYGLLLGCRSGLDGGREKKTFFYAFPPQKTVKSTSDGRARHRNRSGLVELVGREPWIIARVENGLTKVSPQRQ